jgi:hypothetical protein
VGSLSTIQLTPITEFIFTSGSNTRVKITDSGRLGIQTATPVQPLDVSGNAQIRGTLYSQTVSIGGVVPTAPLTVLGNATIQGNVSASNFITLSDRRLKEGIHPIEQGLATIDRLSSVYFTWSGTQRADAGFIAQEVKEVIPEAVDEQQGMYYVKYNTVIPHLVRAVQELQEKVRTLEEKIASR